MRLKFELSVNVNDELFIREFKNLCNRHQITYSTVNVLNPRESREAQEIAEKKEKIRAFFKARARARHFIKLRAKNK